MSTKTNLNKWLEKAAATECTRPVLTWQYSDGAVSMCADGYRAHFVWDNKNEGFTSLKKSVERGSEGRFPDALAIVPSQPDRWITVDAADFQRALKIVHTFRDGSYSVVHLTFDAASIHGGQLILSTRNPERGDVQTAIPYFGSAPDGRFQFNLHYLQDAANGFTDKLFIGLNGPNDPVVIGEMGKQLALIMPMGDKATPSTFNAESIIATQRTITGNDGNWVPFADAPKPRKPARVGAFSKALKEANARRAKAYKLPSPDDLPTGGRCDAIVVIESPLAAVQDMMKDLTQWASMYQRPIYASFNPHSGALYLQTLPGESYRVFVNGHTSIQRVGSSLGQRYESEVGFGKSVAYKTILKEAQGWAEAHNVAFKLLNKAPTS